MDQVWTHRYCDTVPEYPVITAHSDLHPRVKSHPARRSVLLLVHVRFRLVVSRSSVISIGSAVADRTCAHLCDRQGMKELRLGTDLILSPPPSSENSRYDTGKSNDQQSMIASWSHWQLMSRDTAWDHWTVRRWTRLVFLLPLIPVGHIVRETETSDMSNAGSWDSWERTEHSRRERLLWEMDTNTCGYRWNSVRTSFSTTIHFVSGAGLECINPKSTAVLH